MCASSEEVPKVALSYRREGLDAVEVPGVWWYLEWCKVSIHEFERVGRAVQRVPVVQQVRLAPEVGLDRGLNQR